MQACSETPPEMKITNPIVVTKISSTCFACPSQWEGRTSDCRAIYVRYRWGHLSIRVSEPKDRRPHAAVMGQSVFEMDHGGRYDGCLDYEELIKFTEALIAWPKSETPAKPRRSRKSSL